MMVSLCISFFVASRNRQQTRRRCDSDRKAQVWSAHTFTYLIIWCLMTA